MIRLSRIVLTVLASLGVLVIAVVITALIVIQTSWFQNFAREKIIAAAEDATGGKVEVGSFSLSLSALRVTIRDFVLHGTEPQGDAPLLRVDTLDVRLRLFSHSKIVDIEYLGIAHPQANLLVYPDGKTNLPTPKKPSEPSNTSGLQTIVNLAVKHFELTRGTVHFQQQSIPLDVRGDNLLVNLTYDMQSPAYNGHVALDPIVARSGTNAPVTAHFDLPVRLEGDAVRVNNARLYTSNSNIAITAAVDHIAAPTINATANAHISIDEVETALGKPRLRRASGAPSYADAQATINMDADHIVLPNVQLSMGESNVQAAGALKDPGGQNPLKFNGRLVLEQLASLAGVPDQPKGLVTVTGNARLLANSEYVVSGNIQGQNISAQNAGRQLGPVSLNTAFKADPHVISLNGLKVDAFGGRLDGNAQLREMRQIAFNGNLAGFDIRTLSRDLGAKDIAYGGIISGRVAAQGDLKAKGTSGYTAQAHLDIRNGQGGVPVSGRITADYSGKTDTVDLGNSFLTLPHTRLDLAGELGRHLNVKLTSHNLDDFTPALRMASPGSTQPMPVVLQGGTATVNADVAGPLRSPTVDGNFLMTQFAAQQRKFDRLAADLHASESGATISNGVLQRPGLQARFDGGIGLHQWSSSQQSPVKVTLTAHNANVSDLMALAGQPPQDATGTLNTDANVSGTLGNPSGGASIAIANGTAYGESFQNISAKVNFADQLVTLQPLEISAGTARLTASGTYTHPRETMSAGHLQFAVNTNEIVISQFKTLDDRHPGIDGHVHLNANLTADVAQNAGSSQLNLRTVQADIAVAELRDKQNKYGDLTISANTANNAVHYAVNSNLAGSSTTLNGVTQLTTEYPTTLDAAINSLQVEKVLALAGQSSIPAAGVLTAQAHLDGTVANPSGNLSLDLTKANIYSQPINALAGRMVYASNRVQIPALQLSTPGGSVRVNGTLDHPQNDFKHGQLVLHVDSDEIQLAQLQILQRAGALHGAVSVKADLKAGLDLPNKQTPIQLSNLEASLKAGSLQYNSQNAGSLDVEAHTRGNQVALNIDSDLAKASIHGRGTMQIAPTYPVQASVNFSNVHYSNLQPFISQVSSTNTRSTFDALVDGSMTVSGPAANADQLTAMLTLSQVALSTTAPGANQTTPQNVVLVRNQGPLLIAYDHARVDIRSAHLTGRSTDIAASGNIDLGKAQALNVKVNASTDLSILQQFTRDIFSSGTVSVNVTARGTLAQPATDGTVELKNASVNLADSPNGISNANGAIRLSGTSAVIRNLTAESGGGKIALSGFAALTGKTVRYSIRANANRVRTRYSGVSVVSSAALSLNGTLQSSLLSGTVTVDRIAMMQQADTGSLLSFSATPPETPSATTGPLEGIRLDIHVITSSGLMVQTSVTQNVSANADLTVRGTLLNPGILGQVRITQGKLVFFGNEYSVDRGVINFYDPNRIEPNLDIALQTTVQGVDVTLGVSGPVDNMKLNYRSDPPLRFDEIVSLLAAGKTPTSDPTIAAHQPTPPQQSLAQMGESALVSQAVAAPVASRLSRVFGVNQIKIDPTFTSNSMLPQARITLQQQISPTIVFTYTTDLTQTTSQILRVEWAFTPRFSAVATRDEYGIVSLDFFWKKHYR